jgi:hypothetical protein
VECAGSQTAIMGMIFEAEGFKNSCYIEPVLGVGDGGYQFTADVVFVRRATCCGVFICHVR